jgi:hypothetical protein
MVPVFYGLPTKPVMSVLMTQLLSLKREGGVLVNDHELDSSRYNVNMSMSSGWRNHHI